jgi:Restriction alleviation protein Lar
MNGDIQIGGRAHCSACGEDYDSSDIHDCRNVLQSCPFCGSSATLDERTSDNPRYAVWYVRCNGCDVVMFSDLRNYETPDNLVKSWNERVPLIPSVNKQPRVDEKTKNQSIEDVREKTEKIKPEDWSVLDHFTPSTKIETRGGRTLEEIAREAAEIWIGKHSIETSVVGREKAKNLAKIIFSALREQQQTGAKIDLEGLRDLLFMAKRNVNIGGVMNPVDVVGVCEPLLTALVQSSEPPGKTSR